MSVLHVCIYVKCMYLELELCGRWEVSRGFWELDLGLLGEQQILLNIEQSLKPILVNIPYNVAYYRKLISTHVNKNYFWVNLAVLLGGG